MIKTPCRFAKGPVLREPVNLDVQNLASEEVLHPAGARVVLAEYDVLQHDFPELSTESLTRLNPQLRAVDANQLEKSVHLIIDEWLIANAAWISTANAAQEVVNSPIATDRRRTTAYRPPKYGRAVVVPTRGEESVTADGRFRIPAASGLLDLKGAGVAPDRKPSARPQSNGLEHLGTALSDFLVKKAVDEILACDLPTVWTVPVYAVLDLGFDVIGGELEFGPAGLHVRRAHRRRLEEQASAFEHTITYEIEVTLRRYGVTAATIGLKHHIFRENRRLMKQHGRGIVEPISDESEIGLSLALLKGADRVTIDRRDVQLARDVSWPSARAQMVDFGAIRIVPGFDCPMFRDFAHPTFEEVIWPDHPTFVHPDARLQIPVERWERHVLALSCLELANQFRRHELSADDVRNALDSQLLAWTDQCAAACER